jgi:translation initiation factor RLI1
MYGVPSAYGVVSTITATAMVLPCFLKDTYHQKILNSREPFNFKDHSKLDFGKHEYNIQFYTMRSLIYML